MSEQKEIQRLRDLQVDGRQDMSKIDPRVIVVEEGHNPRDYSLPENRAHLENLKASIKENGVQNPLWVRWDNANKKAILVDGECRLKATLELIAEGVEIVSVPVIQKTVSNTADGAAERLVLAMTANEGKPLSQIEVGAAYKRLVNYGWSTARIAQRVAKSERYIKDAIELGDAPAEVKALVAEGSVSKALAIQTVRNEGDNAAATLQVKVAEAKADGKKTAKTEKKAPTPNAKLNAISSLLETYEAEEASDLTWNHLAGYLSDIRDILDGDVAA